MSRHHPSADAVLDGISDQKFEELALRLKAIRDLPAKGERSREVVEAAAKRAGVHPATIYRAILRMEGRGSVCDLMPKARGFPKGRSRLRSEQEEIILRLLKSD